MFECKACGGALRFDIASQKMLCPYCEQTYDPEFYPDQGNAEEYSETMQSTESSDTVGVSKSSEYEVTIFTCPQCGGELGSTETSAAEFCSFCGAPTVLESRLSRMKRPTYIIPFKKTKEECKNELKSHLQKSFFVPNDFKDSEEESFRGIYMPTWNYNIEQKGNVTLKYDTEPAEDPNYRYTYHVKGEVDASYHGLPHDASESFSDRISETLEPYNYKERKDFIPSYLAGFFSDIQDVDPFRYEKEAIELASENTYKKIKSHINTGDGGVLREVKREKLADVIPTKVSDPDNTLIPVWFLSYRKGDRIAYATINGESGKVVTDTPIAIWKVWLLALVMAVPIFFALNLCMTLTPSILLLISVGMLILTDLIYHGEMSSIIAREKNINYERAKRAASKEEKNIYDKEPKKRKIGISIKILGKIGCFVMVSPFLLFFGFCFAYLVFGIAWELVSEFISILYIPYLGAAVILPLVGYSGFKKEPFFYRSYYIIPTITGLVSAYMCITKPISDANYYFAVILNLLAMLLVLSGIWRALNVLTTRPLPQFQKRGGDEYEK